MCGGKKCPVVVRGQRSGQVDRLKTTGRPESFKNQPVATQVCRTATKRKPDFIFGLIDFLCHYVLQTKRRLPRVSEENRSCP